MQKYIIRNCSECFDGIMKRNPNLSVQTKEVIDNGHMPKKVEVLKDIQGLMKERTKKVNGKD